MKTRTLVAVVAIAGASVLASQVGEGWARATGGGSRGSRSYSAPARPSATPSSPSRSLNQPTAAQPGMMQRPGMFGGLMGGLAGFALGGLLGSMLFGGFGGLGHGGLGGGFGLLEMLLIGGGLFFLYRYFMRRRQAQEPAYAMAGGPSRGPAPGSYDASAYGASYGGTATAEPVVNTELERGLAHIRQMDPGFDPGVLADWTRQQFGAVQAALMAKDIGAIRDRLAPEMYGVLLTQCDDLRAAGRTNRIEQSAIERAEVSEAWQESGREYATVYLTGSLIDYTIDDRTGQVVNGSRTDRQRFEEYWTFTRPVGPGAWKLSAIQTQ